MFSLSQEFHRAKAGRYVRPVILFVLTNAFGVRLYSDKQPDQEGLGLVNPTLASGDFLADGSRGGGSGSRQVVDSGARVLSFGRLRERICPTGNGLLAGFKEEEAGRVTVTLANAGGDGNRPFSRLEALENLLGAGGELMVGYPGLKARQYFTRFSGRVDHYRLEAEKLTLGLKAL